MPIYGFGTITAPWSLAKTIKPKDFYKLRDTLKKAKKSFQYSNSELFVKNIKTFSEYNNNVIAEYDSSKLGIETAQYQIMLEKLIDEANRLLGENTKLDKYKLDIMGNWTIGKVIVMEKK